MCCDGVIYYGVCVLCLYCPGRGGGLVEGTATFPPPSAVQELTLPTSKDYRGRGFKEDDAFKPTGFDLSVLHSSRGSGKEGEAEPPRAERLGWQCTGRRYTPAPNQ